jgi:hypothetical protein
MVVPGKSKSKVKQRTKKVHYLCPILAAMLKQLATIKPTPPKAFVSNHDTPRNDTDITAIT